MCCPSQSLCDVSAPATSSVDAVQLVGHPFALQQEARTSAVVVPGKYGLARRLSSERAYTPRGDARCSSETEISIFLALARALPHGTLCRVLSRHLGIDSDPHAVQEGRMGTRSITAIALATVSLLLAPSFVHAADQGITGKKLLLKSTPKLVLLSKDPSIGITGSDPVGDADSSITFDDGTNSVTWSLPASGWSANGSGSLFKYKNAAAPGGPSAVKIAKLKAGLLKVVAKGLPFAAPSSSATINVILNLDGVTNTYCMTFTGAGDGTKFLVKDAAAGACIGSCCQSATNQCSGNSSFCPFGVFPGRVCDGTGQCIPPPGTPGACCESFGACSSPAQQGSCESIGGNVFFPSAVCQPDGTCSDGASAICGNNHREGAEQCDGTDAAACPGQCQADCTCPSVACGNSAYPQCGGQCPPGETCNPYVVSMTSYSDLCNLATQHACACAPIGDTCPDGGFADCAIGGCDTENHGSCPPGRACFGSKCESCTGGACSNFCCALSGTPCQYQAVPVPEVCCDFTECPPSGICP